VKATTFKSTVLFLFVVDVPKIFLELVTKSFEVLSISEVLSTAQQLAVDTELKSPRSSQDGYTTLLYLIN